MFKKLLALLKPKPPVLELPEVAVNERGIREMRGAAPYEIAWADLRSIRIVWSENPWGDPWAGAFCDTDWCLSGAAGRNLMLWDNESNRSVMLPAFALYLPGFWFDYAAFDRLHRKREAQLEGGAYPVWERNGT